MYSGILPLLVVVLETLISSTTGTLLVPCIQPDAAFAVEISGRGRFLNLEFFCQPLKHIIEAIRAETNVIFPVRRIETQNIVTRLFTCAADDDFGEVRLYPVLVIASTNTRRFVIQIFNHCRLSYSSL
jgi:hypothetical protein